MGTRSISTHSLPRCGVLHGTCAAEFLIASRPRGRGENLGRAPCQWSTAGGPVDSQVTQPYVVAPGQPGRTGLHRGHGLTRELRYHHTRLCRSYPHGTTRQIRTQRRSPAPRPNAPRARARGRGDCGVRRHRRGFRHGETRREERLCIWNGGHAHGKALVCTATSDDYQFRDQGCNLDSRCCLHVCYRPFARDEPTLRTYEHDATSALRLTHNGSAAERRPRVPNRYSYHSVLRPAARLTIRRSCQGSYPAREKEITPCRRTAR